jgi:Cof subfamily protein (haloacid dehalogenase superfamily)
MPEIRLLIADVDGTLVTKDKVLTVRAIEAVHRLRAAGVAFAITSGRPPSGMRMLIEPLGLTEPMAAFNGGVIVHPDMSVISTAVLDREVAVSVLHAFETTGIDSWFYTEHDWLVRNPRAPHVEREQWTVKFPPTVVPDFSAYLDRAIKIVGISDDLPLLARCEQNLQSACGTRASVARSQPYYLDVTHPNANKGAVVAALSKMLGIPPTQIATIGDMPNDVLMFKAGGLSIAMGNSSAEVQKQATCVTTSSEEEGFANAVEKFVL